jgi:hypothetical protein
VLLAAFVQIGCESQEPADDDNGAAGMTTAGAGGTAAGAGGVGGAASGGTGGGGGVGGTVAGTAGTESGGTSGTGGAGAAGAGAGGTSGAGAAGAGSGSGGVGGVAGGGTAGNAGNGGEGNRPPANLSETGLFTARGTGPGELILGPGVRTFTPKYWLWSDGAAKKRYIYLPEGTKIDTTDPDHWVFPVGTKLWKSFIVGTQLVETRLIERIAEEPNKFRYAVYHWTMADSTDAVLLPYELPKTNASGTMHDIPNGDMCERCHNALKDHALGFSALQLNHGPEDPPVPPEENEVTLQTLLDEELLTVPISTSIGIPDEDPNAAALGYLHANCGNCHNDSPGLPVENLPEPQMLLRLSVSATTLEQTDTYLTAINQRATASDEIMANLYRIEGGNHEDSVLWYRISENGFEFRMPPLATSVLDDDGVALIASWIDSLPAP